MSLTGLNPNGLASSLVVLILQIVIVVGICKAGYDWLMRHVRRAINEEMKPIIERLDQLESTMRKMNANQQTLNKRLTGEDQEKQ
jgi:CHASE3 domain sensor protein